jgi:hypothetical protein
MKGNALQKTAPANGDRYFYINLVGSGSDIRKVMTMRTSNIVIISNTLMGEKAFVQSPFHLLVRTPRHLTRDQLATQLMCEIKNIEEVMDL